LKITSLEPQKHNRERLNLYVDGVFHCGLDIGTAARLGLYEGKEVTAIEISDIDTEEEYQKCMNSALNLASRRLQSEREYWQKLGKKFDKPVIGKCLDRLRVLGYADDEKFAEMWLRERSRTRGPKLLRIELGQKGIEKRIINELLAERDSTNDLEDALTQALKKYKADDSWEKNYSRIAGLLGRRGYDYGLIKKVTDQIINKTVD
jgi:regulatory protein